MSNINCHECPHDIDRHYGVGGCLAGWDKEGENLCGCDLHPSDIAYALLTAEPTEAEVEAGARTLAGLEDGEDWPTNKDLGGSLTGTRDDEYRTAVRDDALAVLQAAAEARR